MDGRFLLRIPAQQEERVGFVVGRDEVSCVRLVVVKEGVLLPGVVRKIGSSGNLYCNSCTHFVRGTIEGEGSDSARDCSVDGKLFLYKTIMREHSTETILTETILPRDHQKHQARCFLSSSNARLRESDQQSLLCSESFLSPSLYDCRPKYRHRHRRSADPLCCW